MTLASAVYERMRTDIMAGSLKPLEKLRIELLKNRYQTGSSPIREALNRLSTERLVIQHDQRGFTVAPVSLEDFLELTRTRILLYEIAIRESIERGDDVWEERIVVAMHRLTRIHWVFDGDPRRPNPEARKAHREFHRALISACGSRWLLDFADNLFDQAERYRFLSVQSQHGAKRDSHSEHKAIVDATLARDAPLAHRLTTEHIQLTADLVKKAITGESPAPAGKARTSIRRSGTNASSGR